MRMVADKLNGIEHYFSAKNHAFYSLVETLKKELGGSFIVVNFKWKESSFQSISSLEFSIKVPRSKKLKTIIFSFNRIVTDFYLENLSFEKIDIIDYVFNGSIDGDVFWFKSNCPYERILEILNKGYLQYPYSLSNRIFFC